MGNEVIEFILNFTEEFSDSFLYAYILQIILISYMYSCVGSGRYWKIMLVGSLFGMYAAITEHIGTAWLKTIKGETKGSKGLYCYFLAEVGWIATEFSIPYLNLIKLNTLSQGKIIRTINHVIAVLFSFFAAVRLYIGYLRVSNGTLYDDAIYCAHGIAFGITAVADGLLSILIFHHLNKSAEKTKEKDGEAFNLLKSFKKSSLFILFVVDLMSVILAIVSIFSSIPSLNGSLSRLVKPFHALKSNFILVLAIDAFIFKMRATIDGTYLISRYLQRRSKLRSNPGVLYTDNDVNSKRYRNKNSQMLNTVNNSAVNMSTLNNSVNNTSSLSTIKKYRSNMKKNYEDPSSYSINMGMVNNMMVDVYGLDKPGIEKHVAEKHGTEKYSTSSSSSLNENSQSNLKKKKVLQNGKNNAFISQNPVVISPMTPLNPTYNNYVKSSANKNGKQNISVDSINVNQNALNDSINQNNNSNDTILQKNLNNNLNQNNTNKAKKFSTRD